ncbi:hypothetical protein ACHQM5_023350 [Ranunculus cassubicifolius]
MNELFQAYLRKFLLIFFDDILIYSPSMDQHLQHLQLVFQILRQHQLYAKLSKCQFGQSRIEYLGHIISHNRVSADPHKIQGMQDWPQLRTIKGLRGFLGLTGFYRKFVRHYGILASPLTALLQKHKFCWTAEATQAFETLKQAMIKIPSLAILDFTQPFTIETDACDTGIGAVLL